MSLINVEALDGKEIDYLCQSWFQARSATEQSYAASALFRELSKGLGPKPDPGWINGDRPMPGTNPRLDINLDLKGDDGFGL